MKFLGYERVDGQVGVRNYLAVIPTVGCVNELASKIAEEVGAKALLHHQGCIHLPIGFKYVTRTLIGFGTNPNVAAVLTVSLGCEGVSCDKVVEGIAKSGKPVEKVALYDEGGFKNALRRGVELAKKMMPQVSEAKKTSFDLSELVVGVKCGASDATSGIASNPAVGRAMDMLIKEGGSVIFGETTEMIGAEHILTKRARSREVADKILRMVRSVEEEVKRFGIDLVGMNPTPGNIRGGITTIEEKSLGAIVKGGSTTVEDVLEYAERPRKRGLNLMDTPGREMECLSGLAAAGSQIIIFSTGLGAPQGFPTVPVIKVSGNPRTCRRLKEHIDVDVSGILEAGMSLDEAGESIFNFLTEVASGRRTKSEMLGYDRTVDIYAPGIIL